MMTCIMPEEYLTNYARFDILGSCRVIFRKELLKVKDQAREVWDSQGFERNFRLLSFQLQEKHRQGITGDFYVNSFWQLFGCILLRSKS